MGNSEGRGTSRVNPRKHDIEQNIGRLMGEGMVGSLIWIREIGMGIDISAFLLHSYRCPPAKSQECLQCKKHIKQTYNNETKLHSLK